MALWPIFLTVFLAEFGDKTQIAMLLFAADPRCSGVGVFLASAGALVLSSFLAVVLGSQVARYVDARLLKGGAGIGFLALGVWLLLELRLG